MSPIDPVPAVRIRNVHDRSINDSGEFVLYWMIANRRLKYNASLDRALELAHDLNRPLVILEALRSDYRWASDRFHAFVIQGMRDHHEQCENSSITYYPYVEPKPGDGSGLLRSLAEKASAVVSDDFPCFFIPAMIRSAATQIDCRFEVVDSNGLFPMRGTDRVFRRAFDFRRFLQKELPPYLDYSPQPQPLGHPPDSTYSIPKKILQKWAPTPLPADDEMDSFLASIPLDHEVTRSNISGGSVAGQRQIDLFLTQRLGHYGERRNDVEDDVASGLSPYLHFGHVSVHDVFRRIVDHEDWDASRLAAKAKGSSEGWWGMSSSSESFLDELITWRELGYNMCSKTRNFTRFESLPDWAQATLKAHESDPRQHIYSLDEFEEASTHDPLWNAAQRELRETGRMHNYLRMLWGKKILEWSLTPRDALHVMVELNNKYALDGRNPNSYSGIFWVLGRYDRAWGPERPIFGKIRYMSSDNTARKLKVKGYMQRWAAPVDR